MVTSAEDGEGGEKIGGREQEVQTTKCKISYKDKLHNTGIWPVCYNNYMWSIIFKDCELLYTCIISYNNYVSTKKFWIYNGEIFIFFNFILYLSMAD